MFVVDKENERDIHMNEVDGGKRKNATHQSVAIVIA